MPYKVYSILNDLKVVDVYLGFSQTVMVGGYGFLI